MAEDGLSYVFTDGHGIMALSNFYDDLADLSTIRWDVVNAKYWNNFEEGKRLRQAEFMVHEFFPWNLVQGVGVYDENIQAKVATCLSSFPAMHQPQVKVMNSFFF